MKLFRKTLGYSIIIVVYLASVYATYRMLFHWHEVYDNFGSTAILLGPLAGITILVTILGLIQLVYWIITDEKYF